MPEANEKIYMLNALWFKPDGGWEKYKEYLQAAEPHVRKYGGRKLGETFIPKQAIIGEFDADLVFFVEYPSFDAFQQFISDPEYQKVQPLREEAITKSLLIRCDMFET